MSRVGLVSQWIPGKTHVVLEPSADFAKNLSLISSSLLKPQIIITEMCRLVSDLYCYFRVPGLAHCLGYKSSIPHLLEGVMNWVENSMAPDNWPIEITGLDGEQHDRILCSYPTKPVLEACSNPDDRKCWSFVPADQAAIFWVLSCRYVSLERARNSIAHLPMSIDSKRGLDTAIEQILYMKS